MVVSPPARSVPIPDPESLQPLTGGDIWYLRVLYQGWWYETLLYQNA